MFAKSVVNYGDTIVEEQKMSFIESQNMSKNILRCPQTVWRKFIQTWSMLMRMVVKV